MHVKNRRVRQAAVGLFCAAGLVAAMAAPAQAESATTKANTDSYTKSGTVAFTANGECVKYTLSGKIAYTAHKGPKQNDGTRTYWVTNVRVQDPQITVRAVVYSTSSHSCTSTAAKFKALGVRQMFKGYSCSYNPSISVSAPFGVSVSAWPSCGKQKSAQFGYTFKDGTKGTVLRGGTRVTFASKTLGEFTSAPKTGPCYSPVVKLALTTGSINNEPKPQYSPRHKVCLTPSFK